ncbi:MAG: sugar ABC transporter permease [Chloroflexi bacterium]|nr:sugar ABC transporter permease [Chloroflexota bacterium]
MAFNAVKCSKKPPRASARNNPFTPYLYLLPSGVFLLAIMGYPILYSIFMSFQKFNLATLVSRQTEFIGLENYRAVLSNPQFVTALGHSMKFTIFSIFFQFLIGLGLAILFSKAFPLSNTMRGLLLSGWQIPSVVTGTIFLWLFNVDYGLVNFILTSLHVIPEPVGWLTQADTALNTVIMVNIWLGIPFNTILLTAGITGLPDDVFEAATVDGANAWQKLIYMTIPLLKNTIMAVLMLGFIYTLRVFDVIWIMTKGGPADATEVLPTFAYRLSFINFNFGQSSAVSVIILLILMVAAFFYLKYGIQEEK